MAVPDWLKSNAFRVLRLSADASLSEVHKAAASMRRAAQLEAATFTEADMPLLGEIPRTEADIRVATARLENPSQRISDRLFWLHHTIDAVQAVRPRGLDTALWNHDQALRAIFTAFGTGFDEAGIWVWARALRSWHQVVSDDDYWAHVVDLEQQGGFEPAAFHSEVEELRYKAVELAAQPVIMAGRDAVVRNDAPVVRLILFTLEQMADTGLWVSTAQRDIASPAIESFRKLCHTARDDFSSKINRKQDVAKQNKSVCAAEMALYRTGVEPELNKVIQLLPPGYEGALEAREEAALLLSAIAADFTWADEFITSEQLYEEALKLAQNTFGSVRIETGLEEIRSSARKQRVFGQSISSAPALSTINGFGFMLYGHSDFDQESLSYATTHYLTALFLPIVPLGRYRVVNTGDKHYRFLGKLPFRKAERWHLGIGLAVVAILALIFINSSDNTKPYTPPTSAYSNSGTTDPSSEKPELAALRQRIDAGRAQIAILEARLKPVTDELDSLNARMKSLDAELKELDQQRADGLEIDIDHRNSIARDYNDLLKRKRALINANDSDFQSYEDLQKADAAMLEQWKALGGKVN